MRLEELEIELPNGFHDAEIFRIEIDYATCSFSMSVSLLVGKPEGSDPDARRRAVLKGTGLCVLSIDPPYPGSSFLPTGKPLQVTAVPAETDKLPTLPQLVRALPEGVTVYRFFVSQWNSFIHLACRDASVVWLN